MNIVLVGMRGSGKTTIGKLLEKRLQKKRIEMDDLVVEKAGMTIPEMVASHGWDYLRDIEAKVAKEIGQKNNVIISTGGGVVTREENVMHLKKNGKIFWLQAPVDTLVKRIGNDPNRPPLTDKTSPEGELMDVLEHRKKQYEDAADYIITNENQTPEETVEEIIQTIAL